MPQAPPCPLAVIFRYRRFASARAFSEEHGASPTMTGLPSRHRPALAFAPLLTAGGSPTPRPPAAARSHGACPRAPSTPPRLCHP
eukprot:2189666-Pyramimonas_sp.AAC.1